jgi:hypothetical protein
VYAYILPQIKMKKKYVYAYILRMPLTPVCVCNEKKNMCTVRVHFTADKMGVGGEGRRLLLSSDASVCMCGYEAMSGDC